MNIIKYLTINATKHINNNIPNHDKSIFNITVKRPKRKNNTNVTNTEINAILISVGEKNFVILPIIKPFNTLKIVKYNTLVLKLILLPTIKNIKYMFIPKITKKLNKFNAMCILLNLYKAYTTTVVTIICAINVLKIHFNKGVLLFTSLLKFFMSNIYIYIYIYIYIQKYNKNIFLNIISMDSLYKHIEEILIQTGADIKNEEMKNTPKRFINSLMEMTISERKEINLSKLIKFNNDSKSKNTIIIKNIKLSSLCKHHIMPFFGNILIKYQPGKYILGLSKFNVIVNYFSKKLQTQEQLTNDICEFIFNYLEPISVFVSTEMKHTCILNRGVCDPCSSTIIHSSQGIPF